MTEFAHLPTLRLAPGAPEGALPGCRGDLVVSIDHHAGGWSSACEIDVSIDCEAAGCWWSRLVPDAFTVPAALLDEAKQLHATAAADRTTSQIPAACSCGPVVTAGSDNSWPDGPPTPDLDCPAHGDPNVLVPLDTTWPKHCGQPMWFRGGTVREFYCDCGHRRSPEPGEVRSV